MKTSNVHWLILVLALSGCQRNPEIATGTKTDERVEAAAFNGQAYRTANGESAITLISSDELEYRVDNDTTLLCKYSDQGGALRVILTELGTQHVLYFRRVPNGLMSNNGRLYLNAAGLAELRRQDEIARQRQIEAEAAVGRARVERQQEDAIAAQREAEQRRVAEELAQQKAEANRRATLKVLESPACTEGEYNVPARPEFVFTLSDRRECWTPWLVLENSMGVLTRAELCFVS
jgi:hypothetical protein